MDDELQSAPRINPRADHPDLSKSQQPVEVVPDWFANAVKAYSRGLITLDELIVTLSEYAKKA